MLAYGCVFVSSAIESKLGLKSYLVRGAKEGLSRDEDEDLNFPEKGTSFLRLVSFIFSFSLLSYCDFEWAVVPNYTRERHSRRISDSTAFVSLVNL